MFSLKILCNTTIQIQATETMLGWCKISNIKKEVLSQSPHQPQMADNADDGSRRLKGPAVKAWQFLIPKKRKKVILSDDESSINNQVSIQLSPSARKFIIPFKPKGPAKKAKNTIKGPVKKVKDKILSKILPKKISAKEQSTNDKESVSEVRVLIQCQCILTMYL